MTQLKQEDHDWDLPSLKEVIQLPVSLLIEFMLQADSRGRAIQVNEHIIMQIHSLTCSRLVLRNFLSVYRARSRSGICCRRWSIGK